MRPRRRPPPAPRTSSAIASRLAARRFCRDLWDSRTPPAALWDALDASAYQQLMVGEQAEMVFTDPPYNVHRWSCVRPWPCPPPRVPYGERRDDRGGVRGIPGKKTVFQRLAASSTTDQSTLLHGLATTWARSEEPAARSIRAEEPRALEQTNGGMERFTAPSTNSSSCGRRDRGAHQQFELGQHRTQSDQRVD